MLHEGEKLDLHHLSYADDTLSTPSHFGLDASGQLTIHTDYDFGETQPPASADAASPAALDMNQLAHELLRQGPGQLAAMEGALVRSAVQQAGGNITRAAALLGLSRAQTEYRYRKLQGAEN